MYTLELISYICVGFMQSVECKAYKKSSELSSSLCSFVYIYSLLSMFANVSLHALKSTPVNKIGSLFFCRHFVVITKEILKLFRKILILLNIPINLILDVNTLKMLCDTLTMMTSILLSFTP